MYRKLKVKAGRNGSVFYAAPGKQIPPPPFSRFLPTLLCILHQFFLDGSKLIKIKRRKFIVTEIKEIPAGILM
jgi:hypothetical protein